MKAPKDAKIQEKQGKRIKGFGFKIAIVIEYQPSSWWRYTQILFA